MMVAVDELIIEHLDIWATTVKAKSAAGRGSRQGIDLYGSKKLRELILGLAVRGLLLPQDPDDEPASELLRKISKEKDKLIQEGKIKKQKPLPPIREEEKSFKLPKGWHWVRLNDAFDVRDGTHDTPRYHPTGYPLVTSKNLSSGRLDLSDVRLISEADHQQITTRSKVDRGDILFAMIGSIGNPVLVDIDPNFSIKNVALFKYYSRELSCPQFLLRLLYVAEKGIKAAALGAVQSFASLGDIRRFVIAIPPLAEQHRIVAKVDELMALCDTLEQQQFDSVQSHQVLVETLLAALTRVSSHQELSTAWARIAENFDVLFTTEQSVDQLKAAILQLAVMGKLVDQNRNNESARTLLERIKVEKEREMARDFLLASINRKDEPFQLPEGWQWECLGNLGSCVTGKTPSTKNQEYFQGSIPFIGPGQITSTGELLPSDKHLSEEGIQHSAEALAGDILMVCIGGSIGKTVISDRRLAFNQQINAIRPLLINSQFLHYAISTTFFLKSVLESATGSATPIINRSRWEQLLVPVAPLEEQDRIVAKVEELMTVCDHLKSHLAEAQTTQLHLANAVVEQTINEGAATKDALAA